VRKLTNDEATHEAIKAAFQEHLISHARAWAEAGGEGEPPAFLFHYSGHGSQARDETGSEPDGMDETIVPHDSRLAGVYDIKDWELGQLLEELGRYSTNITVILDCCHSGSGTRDLRAGMPLTRRCEPDLRPQPTQRPANLAGTGTRAVGSASGWTTSEQYVLLAGCRDREEAHEHAAAEGESARTHGALSHFLIKELAQMRPERPLTYRELHERVRYEVNRHYEDQMPQCEGDRERELFGGLRPAHEPFLTVVDKAGGFIWVDGGVVHGLTEGSQLHVYPSETRTLEEAGEPVTTLAVVEVGIARSGCIVEEGERNIPLHARAVVYRLNHGDMQRRVLLDVPEGALRAALVERLSTGDVEPYVKVVAPGDPAFFRVALVDDRLEIQNAIGTLLVAPFAPDALDELARDLTHLVRYHNGLELRNTAPTSELAGSISVALKKLDFDTETQEPLAVPIEPEPGGELVVETGELIVIEVTNHSNRELYFSVLDYSYDWSVTQLYPQMRGAHEPLEAGKSYTLGLSRRRREQLTPTLPPEIPEAREIVKVIATAEDADFEILEQLALKTPYT
ncbi:MAG: caspase family protein, partial [Ardenticatenaceae bacterium]